MLSSFMKNDMTRQQKAMIFTLSLLSDAGIEGLEKMDLNEKGKDQLRDFQPTTDEVEKCIDILVKKGYLSMRV